MEDTTARFLFKELILHPIRYWKSWGIIFILAIITHGSAWIVALKKGRESVKIELSQEIEQIYGTTDVSEKNTQEIKRSCYKEIFSENESKWETKFYIRQGDGFWCPTQDLDPVIWYKDGLIVNFSKLTIEYEIKENDRLKRDNPPSFILAYGRKEIGGKPIFKLWVPEGEILQLFGFEKNSDFDSEEQNMDRENAVSLKDPVQIRRVDKLTIEPTRKEGNNLYINFIYYYTSSNNLEGEDDTIQKEVKLPVSNIQSSTQKLPFGIGTYVGNCIKPISYEICL